MNSLLWVERRSSKDRLAVQAPKRTTASSSDLRVALDTEVPFRIAVKTSLGDI
jgi:hypothetical protein